MGKTKYLTTEIKEDFMINSYFSLKLRDLADKQRNKQDVKLKRKSQFSKKGKNYNKYPYL